jgi:hypothetical protein
MRSQFRKQTEVKMNKRKKGFDEFAGGMKWVNYDCWKIWIEKKRLRLSALQAAQ